MRFNRKFLILPLLFSILACSESIELELNPKAGKTHQLNSTGLSTVQQIINGEDIVMTSETVMNIDFTPMDAGEFRNSVIEAQFSKISLLAQSKFGEVFFESGKDQYDDITEYMISRLTKFPFNVQMRANGEVSKISGINRVISEAFKIVDYSEDEGNVIREALLLSYGPEPLTSHIEMALSILPTGPVKLGDTWNTSTLLRSNVYARAQTTCKLEKIERDYVLIRTESEVIPEDKNRYVNISGAPMRYDVQGASRGLYRVNRKTGWTEQATIDMNLEGTSYTRSPDGKEIAIPLKISSKIEFTN
ncbi:MAG: hypothetical protein EA358_07350 [Flavobacteriales bacterium]|nr:MAG: hypothetical protein EA358_07350 [Flavobacteriales bacterium]